MPPDLRGGRKLLLALARLYTEVTFDQRTFSPGAASTTGNPRKLTALGRRKGVNEQRCFRY